MTALLRASFHWLPALGAFAPYAPAAPSLALKDWEEGIPERAEEARGAFHVGVDQRHDPLVPHAAQRDATPTRRQRDCPVSRRH